MIRSRSTKTGPELLSELEADPVWVAQRQERERVFAERAARFRAEEEPMLADLRAIGWDVESVWFLANRGGYPEAIPVLLKHLLLPYSDPIRAGIAYALAVPEARYVWPTLVAEYRKAPFGRAKDGLAVAVSEAVPNAKIDEVIDLAKDPSLGGSRLLLLRRLRRSKNPAAKQALEELASDPDLEKEIASFKKKKRR